MIRVTAAYERYFADKYKNYDTFWSFLFRSKGKSIKRIKIKNKLYLDEKSIERYLKKEDLRIQKKYWCLELLENISIEGNLNKAGIALGFKCNSQIYEIVKTGIIGDSMLKRIRKNKKKLLELAEKKSPS